MYIEKKYIIKISEYFIKELEEETIANWVRSETYSFYSDILLSKMKPYINNNSIKVYKSTINSFDEYIKTGETYNFNLFYFMLNN